jgi:hypothetical protein
MIAEILPPDAFLDQLSGSQDQDDKIGPGTLCEQSPHSIIPVRVIGILHQEPTGVDIGKQKTMRFIEPNSGAEQGIAHDEDLTTRDRRSPRFQGRFVFLNYPVLDPADARHRKPAGHLETDREEDHDDAESQGGPEASPRVTCQIRIGNK